MSNKTRTRDEVQRRAETTLMLAERGYADLVGEDPAVRWAGLHNVAVFGRSVSLVLQTARTVLGNRFDTEWYEKAISAFIEWEAASVWVALRNEILKEGPPLGSVHVAIDRLDSTDLEALQAAAPAGATTMFIGDHNGGSGWEVDTGAGVERFYLKLPGTLSDRVHVSLRLPGADVDAVVAAREYLDRLTELVESAKAYFASVEWPH